MSALSAQHRDSLEMLNVALKLLDVPANYVLNRVREGSQNGEEVWIFRYAKRSGASNGLGGEHYSFVARKRDGRVLGCTWMDRSLADGALPEKDAAAACAWRFLDRVAPGLSGQLEVLWIERHDERIAIIENGKPTSIIISGMKVKCRDKENDDYAWVVAGPNEAIVTFERGIRWVNGRVTEKWLHDGWLQER